MRLITIATTRSQRGRWNVNAFDAARPARSNRRRRRAARARVRRVLTASSLRFERRRRLARREPLHVAQHEHLALPVRQRVDGRFDEGLEFASEGLAFRVERPHRRLPRFRGLVVEGFVAAARPRTCDRFVHRDPREPCRERGAPIELAQVGVGVHVRLLHHVFRFRLVAHDRARRAVDPLVVAAHQDLEQRRLSADDARDDLLVGQRLPALEHAAVDHMHGGLPLLECAGRNT